MRVLYVSEDTINKCINYFNNISISSPEQLGLFFFFKSIGFTEKEYHIFPKISAITEDDRKDYLNKLYKLSGIFDYEIENGEEKCCLFPFSITAEIGKKDLYNPGTTFKGLLSRVRDTVDNTLIDDSKFLRKDENNSDGFKFPQNYISILKNTFLLKQRVSLVEFSAWYFRFRGIECPDEWIDNSDNVIYQAFTRVCVKMTIDELLLNEEELNELFFFDENDIIKFCKNKISGSKLREKIKFHKDYVPKISELSVGGSIYMNNIKNVDLIMTEELAQPIGNNITEEKLYYLLKATKQVILYGVPGTSKSYLTNSIKNKFYSNAMIQFHASMNYEQFIGGISVDESGNFISKAGIFLSFCQEARMDTTNDYLFIIDEINRGNVSKIFGETILTLDRAYVVDLANEVKWNDLVVSKFSIPNNVYIIATMNSADRSIAQIDYAIRRRFAFVKFYPNYELISAMSDCSNLNGIKPDILLKSINKAIFNVLKDENMLLGHAYFIPKWAVDDSTRKIVWSMETLQMLINYYIVPIIEEYTYGNNRYLTNILGNEIPKRINDLDVFASEIKKQFKVN